MNTQRKKIMAVAGLAAIAAAVLAWRILAPGEFFYAGTIEATEIDVPARVASVIATIDPKEGDTVRRGQRLVSLAGEDIRLAADMAERNYRRAAELYKAGSMPQAEYDRLRYLRDDASLRRGWCEIKAPSDGVILTIYFEPGEMVTPGAKLLTLADLREVRAFVYVAQPLLAKLKPGMPVTGRLPELKGRAFEGRVAHIREEAEFTPRNVQTRDERVRLVYGIKVIFPNPDGILKPGMTIEVSLPK
jgi:HlyD family secretion protein